MVNVKEIAKHLRKELSKKDLGHLLKLLQPKAAKTESIISFISSESSKSNRKVPKTKTKTKSDETKNSGDKVSPSSKMKNLHARQRRISARLNKLIEKFDQKFSSPDDEVKEDIFLECHIMTTSSSLNKAIADTQKAGKTVVAECEATIKKNSKFLEELHTKLVKDRKNVLIFKNAHGFLEYKPQALPKQMSKASTENTEKSVSLKLNFSIDDDRLSTPKDES